MGNYIAIGAVFAMWAAIIGGVIGWFLNLFHCLAYIGGGHPDDSTVEVAVRLVGIFTLLPGAILGWLL